MYNERKHMWEGIFLAAILGGTSRGMDINALINYATTIADTGLARLIEKDHFKEDQR